MNDQKVQDTILGVRGVVDDYYNILSGYTSSIRPGLRAQGSVLREGVALRIVVQEAELTREIALLTRTAEYHILNAHYLSSPGLIKEIIALIKFIGKVLDVIIFLNDVLVAVTDQTLAYWLDYLVPGFEEWWKDTMNTLSKFSGLLGWGVDGVGHLINAYNAGVETWGLLTRKGTTAQKMEKVERIERLANNFRVYLDKWEKNPGEMIEGLAHYSYINRSEDNTSALKNFLDRIDSSFSKAEQALQSIGTITDELLGIREDMPGFIAKNIPSVIWDSLEKADSMINDRVLPAITHLNDQIEEINSVLETQRKRAQELADRIAHPGDLLSEIDKLPLYARLDQEDKIDDIATRKLKRDTSEGWEAERVDLRAFDKVYAAMTAPIPPPEFMELEVPGRGVITGIAEEPRETWFAGDY